jgi:hypothetical protein
VGAKTPDRGCQVRECPQLAGRAAERLGPKILRPCPAHLPAKQLAAGEISGARCKAAGALVAHAHTGAGHQAGGQQGAEDAASNLVGGGEQGAETGRVTRGRERWPRATVKWPAGSGQVACPQTACVGGGDNAPAYLQGDVQHSMQHGVEAAQQRGQGHGRVEMAAGNVGGRVDWAAGVGRGRWGRVERARSMCRGAGKRGRRQSHQNAAPRAPFRATH